MRFAGAASLKTSPFVTDRTGTPVSPTTKTRIFEAVASSGDFNLSKVRLESFSDGVFAVAITLLVLELHLPTWNHPPTTSQQIAALVRIWPQYLVYFVSFGTIGIMWLNHHALLRNCQRISHGMVLANLLLLSLIAFLPFPTEVLARFGVTRVAVVYYGLTMIAISIAFNVVYQQVLAAHPEARQKVTLWSIIGLTLYPLATIIGFFWPFGGIAAMGVLAIFYMQYRNVRSIALQTNSEG
jgi:uncharacterized membrane protein